MSENNDNDDDGFISRLSSTGSEYIELISEIREDEQDVATIDSNTDLKFITRPSSEEVSKEAMNELVNEVGSREEITFEEPAPVIREAERIFMQVRDETVKKIEDIKRKEEESVSGSDVDTLLYIVDKNAGKTGNFTIFGGAESFILNVAESQGWSEHERDLVLKANRIAGEKNDLQRHLLLDTVVIIPNNSAAL